MRVLVLSSEVWNDNINGNNVTSNWFEGMKADFANIYCSPGKPYNKCCFEYFQITDWMMFKSIISSKKAGKRVIVNQSEFNVNAEEEPEKVYKFLKGICGSFLRLLRELIWLFGRYDIDSMKQFISDFSPDIIFSERMASVKMLRLEKTVLEIAKVPMLAFTGDDEYSLRQLSFSPFFWINRFMVRHRLRDMVRHYKIYYTLSDEQKADYENRFGCYMKILRKCGKFNGKYSEKKPGNPIRFVYAGKLYMNRWKALGEIADSIRNINGEGKKAILEIYTSDRPTKSQMIRLEDGKSTFIKSRVSQEELKKIYRESDVAIHVESGIPKYALQTRLSFSTKIIDCIFSGCAVLAYCRRDQSGWRYLKREKAAVCVSDIKSLKKAVQLLCTDTEAINYYARKAYRCGIKNHDREHIQKELLEDFYFVKKKYSGEN